MALSSTLVSLGIVVSIYALLALGLNVKFGYTGLLDIGHVAFYLVGAYVTALLVLPPASEQFVSTYVLGWGWPWAAALAGGTLMAGFLGLLVALPAIRLREDYFAIAVLGISVILKRVVQSEKWLANGPGPLRGFQQPLRTYFPLPGDGLGSAILFGVVVFVLWTIATYLLAEYGDERRDGTGVPTADGGSVAEAETGGISDTGLPGGRAINGLLALTTLGVGYWAAQRENRVQSPAERRYLLVPGLVVGAVALVATLLAGRVTWIAAALAYLGFYYASDHRYVLLAGTIAGITATGVAAALGAASNAMVALLFLGLLSLFTWVFGAVVVAKRYRDFSRRDFLIAFGLALIFVATFLPLIVLGGSGDVMSSIGLFATVALLAAFLYGVYYVGDHWSSFDSDVEFVRIVGVGAIWLFLIRYFVLANVGPLKQGGLAAVASNTFQNLVWLAEFTATGAAFDYSRFLLVIMLAAVGVAYYLTEVTVRSPFGRVLKAIREDEDVATALGKDTFSFKVQSMVLGSALAGFAGGMTAIYYQSLVHTMFVPRITFIAFLMVIIGGTANNRGVILGAVIYWAFEKATADIAAFFPTAANSSVHALRLAFIGALLIVILYYRPEGLWGERRTVGEVTKE